jgi:hypothetical protein
MPDTNLQIATFALQLWVGASFIRAFVRFVNGARTWKRLFPIPFRVFLVRRLFCRDRIGRRARYLRRTNAVAASACISRLPETLPAREEAPPKK